MILAPTLPPALGLGWWALACVAALCIRPVSKQSETFERLCLGAALWRARLELSVPVDALALGTIGLTTTPFWAGAVLDAVGTLAALGTTWDMWQGDLWTCLLTAQFIAADTRLPYMALRAVVALVARHTQTSWFWASVLAQGRQPTLVVVTIGTWLVAEILQEWVWPALAIFVAVQWAANTIKALRT